MTPPDLTGRTEPNRPVLGSNKDGERLNARSKCRCSRLLGRSFASDALDDTHDLDLLPARSGAGEHPRLLSCLALRILTFPFGKRRMLAKGGCSRRPSVSSPPPAIPSLHRESPPHRFVLLVPDEDGHRCLTECPRIQPEGDGLDETRCAEFCSTMGVGSTP